MIKKMLFISLVIVFSSIAVMVFLLSLNAEKKTSQPDIPIPTPIKGTSPLFSPNLEREKFLQETYAKDRAEFLNQNSWYEKLPLKSENYLVIYNTEKEEFVSSIYYYPHLSVPKEKQIEDAKQKVLDMLTYIGVDTKKEKVVFIETEIE